MNGEFNLYQEQGRQMLEAECEGDGEGHKRIIVRYINN